MQLPPVRPQPQTLLQHTQCQCQAQGLLGCHGWDFGGRGRQCQRKMTAGAQEGTGCTGRSPGPRPCSYRPPAMPTTQRSHQSCPLSEGPPWSPGCGSLSSLRKRCLSGRPHFCPWAQILPPSSSVLCPLSLGRGSSSAGRGAPEDGAPGRAHILAFLHPLGSICLGSIASCESWRIPCWAQRGGSHTPTAPLP